MGDEFLMEVYRCEDPASRVYRPSHDTSLLADSLASEADLLRRAQVILDLGTGSGYIAKTIRDLLRGLVVSADVIAIDISPCAVMVAKENLMEGEIAETMVIQCSGAECLRNKIIDLVAINPPYLPVDERSDWLGYSWSGGYKGVSVALEFLKGLVEVLRDGGVIYIVLSSLGDLEYFERETRRLCYELEIVRRARLFFEELVIYRIRRAKC
jgi:release factor glutamine methyltransferase